MCSPELVLSPGRFGIITRYLLVGLNSARRAIWKVANPSEIPVASMDDCIARVEAAGGKIIEPKMPIQGIGWLTACAEPGGLLFGVMEDDPEAE
jgi:predicted enzyme related to lactoylglutathione lyase